MAKLIAFSKIQARAAKRKGGIAALEEMLPDTKSPRSLQRIKDDRWLAGATKAVFSAGFVWSVVENKWEGFETCFWDFAPAKVATASDDDLEKIAGDTRVIRNRTKIWATRDNARFMLDAAEEYGSFGKMVVKWPKDDLIGLYAMLKKRGSRLGGMSAQYFLRFKGVDTFMLTKSVNAAMIFDGVIDKAPTSKKAMRSVQDAFNEWGAQSGRSMSAMSRILAYSVP